MKKFLLLAGALCCSALIGCAQSPDKAPSFEERTTVQKVTIRDVLTQTGEVRPLVKVQLKSEASGRIKKIYVKEGQRISRGDTILVIDPLRLQYQKERTDLAVKRAQIQAQRSKRDYEQAQTLLSTGTVSENQIKNLQNDYDLSEIGYQQQLLELKDIVDQLQKTVITAPMSGVLTILSVEEGEIAVSATSGFQAGTDIGTISDISKLEVVSQIGEVDYVNLHLGQKVMIKPEAFENEATQGTITFIALSAKKAQGQELGNFEVRMSVDSVIPGIAPGINVNVEFVLMERKDVLGIPTYFVERKGDGWFVNLVKKDKTGEEKIAKIPVRVGRTDYKNFEIKSGLKEGDMVYFKQQQEGEGQPPGQQRGFGAQGGARRAGGGGGGGGRH